MTNLKCAICGNKQEVKEYYKPNFDNSKIDANTFSARRTPDRMHYRFVKCNNCSLIFSNPVLPAKKILNLYKNSTFDYHNESSYLKKTYAFYLQKALGSTGKKNTKLLDIGCGNGFFLEEARNMGIKYIYGIEPGVASVKNAPKWLQKCIKIGLFEKNTYKSNTFDVITCFHTLDHVLDPNKFLHGVNSALKKDGKALFIVHDTDGLSVKLFGEKSPIFDIEHIYLFNKKNLSLLFKKNKFKVVETFDIKNNYPIKYWVRMSPLPKKIKNIVMDFLEKVNLANFPLSLRAGNIGIIAKK